MAEEFLATVHAGAGGETLGTTTMANAEVYRAVCWNHRLPCLDVCRSGNVRTEPEGMGLLNYPLSNVFMSEASNGGGRRMWRWGADE
jgi:hypothetical protein